MKKYLAFASALCLAMSCVSCGKSRTFEDDAFTLTVGKGYTQVSENNYYVKGDKDIRIGLMDDPNRSECSEQCVSDYNKYVAYTYYDNVKSEIKKGTDNNIICTSYDRIDEVNGTTTRVLDYKVVNSNCLFTVYVECPPEKEEKAAEAAWKLADSVVKKDGYKIPDTERRAVKGALKLDLSDKWRIKNDDDSLHVTIIPTFADNMTEYFSSVSIGVADKARFGSVDEYIAYDMERYTEGVYADSYEVLQEPEDAEILGCKAVHLKVCKKNSVIGDTYIEKWVFPGGDDVYTITTEILQGEGHEKVEADYAELLAGVELK